MLKTWWKIIRTAIIVIGVLLSFFAVIEMIRAYQTLHNLHPVAGMAFLLVLIIAGVWFIVYLGVNIGTRPPVLIVPNIKDFDTALGIQLRRYAKYLAKYLNRLSVNSSLLPDDQRKAEEAIEQLDLALEDAKTKEHLLEVINDTEQNKIEPLLKKLDNQVEKEIRASVAIVMAGVTLSPYKAADLLIVLYRNFAMVSRIIRVYNSRPRLREQMKILSDIVNVVVTVNYINMGQNLIESLLSRVPGIGKFTDEIAQGIGAGFMTSVVGHAAMHRCRAFKRWDQQEAQDTLRARAAGFYADVRDMFKKDVLPKIARRIGDTSKDTIDKIGTAIDESGNMIGSFIMTPFRAVVNTGGHVTRRSSKKIRAFARLFKKRRKKVS